MNRMASLMMGAALLLLAGAGQLAAQSGSEPSPLVISADNITAKADVAAGKRAATAISAVVPGDVVEYRLVFTNTKKSAVLNIVFQDPIPAGLQPSYGDDRAVGSEIWVDLVESLQRIALARSHPPARVPRSRYTWPPIDGARST